MVNISNFKFNYKNVSFLILAGMAQGGCKFFDDPSGPLAPPFQATIDPKGETYSLLDLTQTKPVVVIFTKVNTVEGKKAIKFTEQLVSALGDSTQVLIIAPILPIDIVRWQDQFPAAAPILPDPDRKIGGNYRIKGTPTIVLIGNRARLLGQWDGITGDIVKDLNTRLIKEIDSKGWKKPISSITSVPPIKFSDDYYTGKTPELPKEKVILN